MSILLLLCPLVYMVSVVTHVPDVGLSPVSSLIPDVFPYQTTVDFRHCSDRVSSPRRIKLTVIVMTFKGHLSVPSGRSRKRTTLISFDVLPGSP